MWKSGVVLTGSQAGKKLDFCTQKTKWELREGEDAKGVTTGKKDDQKYEKRGGAWMLRK